MAYSTFGNVENARFDFLAQFQLDSITFRRYGFLSKIQDGGCAMLNVTESSYTDKYGAE